ncbi:MAG: FecR family protein [Bacteroidota bacterium]
MKTTALALAGILSAAPAAWASAPPAPSVALISKTILDVTRQSGGGEWERALRGEALASGDRVRTGLRSLAIVKFLDNSLVRIRERSELTVTGESRGGSLTKTVNLDRGVVGFNIRKQRSDEEFRFTSPTSVASIRGTGGQLSAQASSDTLTVIEGAVLLTNRISERSITVRAGFTGISAADGSILERPSTPAERQAAMQASRSGDRNNLLELELRNDGGQKRRLRIEYRE